MSEAKKKTTTKKAVKKPRINKVETVDTPVKEQVKATETPAVESVIDVAVTKEINEEVAAATSVVEEEVPVIEEEKIAETAENTAENTAETAVTEEVKVGEPPVIDSVIETTIIEEVKEEKVPEKIVEEVVPFDWETISQNDNYTKTERVHLEKEYSTTLPDVIDKQVIDGVVVMVTDREVVVDINFKSDGVLSFNEFKYNPELKVGDTVEVLVEKQEDKNGQLVLSHRRARVLRAWEKVNVALETGEVVNGQIKSRTKGGMIVDVFGIECFLPGSQIDVKPIRDYDEYVGKRNGIQSCKSKRVFQKCCCIS
jgi:small subunit ribosomal protein S1